VRTVNQGLGCRHPMQAAQLVLDMELFEFRPLSLCRLEGSDLLLVHAVILQWHHPSAE